MGQLFQRCPWTFLFATPDGVLAWFLEQRKRRGLGPLKGVVPAVKVFQGSETKTNYLYCWKERIQQGSVYPPQSGQINKANRKVFVSDQTWWTHPPCLLLLCHRKHCQENWPPRKLETFSNFASSADDPTGYWKVGWMCASIKTLMHFLMIYETVWWIVSYTIFFPSIRISSTLFLDGNQLKGRHFLWWNLDNFEAERNVFIPHSKVRLSRCAAGKNDHLL